MCIADWQQTHLGQARRDLAKLISTNCPQAPHSALLAYHLTHDVRSKDLTGHHHTNLILTNPEDLSFPELLVEYTRYSWILLVEMLASVAPSFAQMESSGASGRIQEGMCELGRSLCAAVDLLQAADSTAPLFPFPTLRTELPASAHDKAPSKELLSSPVAFTAPVGHYVFTVGVMDRLHNGHKSLLQSCANACRSRGWAMKVALCCDGASWVSKKTLALLTESFQTRALHVCSFWAEIAPDVPLDLHEMTQTNGVAMAIAEHAQTVIVVDQHSGAESHVAESLRELSATAKSTVEIELVEHVEGISSSLSRCRAVQAWWHQSSVISCCSQLEAYGKLNLWLKMEEYRRWSDAEAGIDWFGAGESRANGKAISHRDHGEDVDQDMYSGESSDSDGSGLRPLLPMRVYQTCHSCG